MFMVYLLHTSGSGYGCAYCYSQSYGYSYWSSFTASVAVQVAVGVVQHILDLVSINTCLSSLQPGQKLNYNLFVFLCFDKYPKIHTYA